MILILIIVAVALLATWIFCYGLALAAGKVDHEIWKEEEEKEESLEDVIESHFID